MGRLTLLGAGATSAGSSFLPSDLGAAVPFWVGAQYGSTVHTSGSNVTAWDNQGALGGSAVVPPAGPFGPGTSPTVLSAALNGKNAIHGDGVDHSLYIPSFVFPSASQYSLFVILRRNVASASETFFGISPQPNNGGNFQFAGGAFQWIAAAGDFVVYMDGYDNTAGGQPPQMAVAESVYGTDTTNFFHLQIDMGTTNALIKNGTPLTKYWDTNASITGTTTNLGLFFQGGASNSYGNVDIAELILGFNLTSGNKTSINNYLTAQWGI